MEILNADEIGDLLPLGRGRFSELYKNLIILKVGQAISICYSDWKIKTTPYRTIRNVEKAYGRQFEYGHHPDGSGWLVKRVG